jgi:hypothetical protein
MRTPVGRIVSAAAVIVLAVIPPRAAWCQAPDGFKTCENKDEGFLFHYPKAFEEIPPQPGDPVVLANFVRKPPPPPKPKKGTPRPSGAIVARIWILSIDKPPAAGAAAAASPESAPPPDSESEPAEPEKSAAATTAADALAEKLQATSFEDFLKKRTEGWRIVNQAERADRTAKRTYYELDYAPKGRSLWKGCAWMLHCEDRWLGLFGMCLTEDYETQRKAFEKSALSLREIKISEREAQELERYYSMRKELKDPAFRIARRRNLVRGWKALDTRNYLIVHHTKDEALLSRVQNDIEAMRLLYEELFPPVRPIEAVSVVRVCKDRQEYLLYGGQPGTSGHWYAAGQELVLFDNVKGQHGSRLGNRDSYIVLYHEAFHQYIYYAVGEVEPHYWFNEGYGDYFSGTKIYSNSMKIQEIGPNPWRLGLIKKAVENKQHVTLDWLVRAERDEYYRRERAGLYYAQGWSFIYFLNKSPAAQANLEWKEILPVYFQTLKDTYAQELEALGPGATLEQKGKAGQKARIRALDVAFEGVNMQELQAEWEKFVKRLR